MGRLFSDTRGAAKIEYTLLVGLISVGVVATVAAVGETTKSVFTDVADAISGHPQAGSTPGAPSPGTSSPGGSPSGGKAPDGASPGGTSPGGASPGGSPSGGSAPGNASPGSSTAAASSSGTSRTASAAAGAASTGTTSTGSGTSGSGRRGSGAGQPPASPSTGPASAESPVASIGAEPPVMGSAPAPSDGDTSTAARIPRVSDSGGGAPARAVSLGTPLPHTAEASTSWLEWLIVLAALVVAIGALAWRLSQPRRDQNADHGQKAS